MNHQNHSNLQRRDILKGVAAASLGLAAGAHGVSGSDRIRKENEKPGTRDWMLTNTRQLPGKINKILSNGRCPWIEGYCSMNSVRAGEKLQVMVSTNPASAFKLEIFRTGYYNGDGGRLMQTFDTLEGKTQPDPPVGENYVRECNWEPSVEFEIPEDWLSGVYLGKLTAEREKLQSYVIFIVRDDRPCDFLFQCSDLTWSAYNRWPADYSIYTPHKKGFSTTGVPSGTVSFDRPYGLFTHPVNRMKRSGGSGEYLPWSFHWPSGWSIPHSQINTSPISNDRHPTTPTSTSPTTISVHDELSILDKRHVRQCP